MTELVTALQKLITRRRNVYFILLIIGLIIYANVLAGKFIFDDELIILRNTQIRVLNILQFFSTNTTAGAFIPGSNFYRPLQLIIYAVFYQLFQLEVMPYHILPVLLHITNAFLFYVLLTKLGLKRLTSFCCSLVFLIHPVATEAVAYISGLADPLGTFFMFGALLGTLKYISEPKLKYAAVVILGTILAVLSKESYIVTGPLSVLLVLSLNNFSLKKITRNARILLITSNLICGIFLILKFSVFNFTPTVGLNQVTSSYTQSIWIRLASFISSIYDYAVILIFPKDLYYEKQYVFTSSLFTLKGGFGLLVILIVLLGLIYGIVHKRKYLALGTGWVLLTMLPVTGIIPLNAIYLEHWLYVPLFGLLILAGYVIERQKLSGRNVFLFILVIVMLLLSLRTVARNYQWANPEAFYENELNYYPSARIYNNLGNELANEGNLNGALEAYKQAVKLDDSYPETRYNMGNIYMNTGDPRSALKEYLNSLNLDPNFIYTHAKLALIFNEQGDLARAKAFSEFAQRISTGGKVTLEEIEIALKQ